MKRQMMIGNQKEDVEGVWLIAQHADNDVELQQMIFELLESNKDMLSQKFNIPIQEVLYGIAMLTDRIMVNSSTGLQGYRDNNKEDFSDFEASVWDVHEEALLNCISSSENL